MMYSRKIIVLLLSLFIFTSCNSQEQKADDKKTGARSNTINPIYRKVTQQDIDNLGLDKVRYDPKTGAGQIGKLSNIKY